MALSSNIVASDITLPPLDLGTEFQIMAHTGVTELKSWSETPTTEVVQTEREEYRSSCHRPTATDKSPPTTQIELLVKNQSRSESRTAHNVIDRLRKRLLSACRKLVTPKTPRFDAKPTIFEDHFEAATPAKSETAIDPAGESLDRQDLAVDANCADDNDLTHPDTKDNDDEESSDNEEIDEADDSEDDDVE